MSVHEPNSYFICQFCNIKFKSKSNEMKHMKKNHNSTDTEKSCTSNGELLMIKEFENRKKVTRLFLTVKSSVMYSTRFYSWFKINRGCLCGKSIL